MGQITTNKISFFVLTFLALILIETLFFHNASIFFILIGAVLIHFGMKKHSKQLFFLGLLFIVLAMFTFWSLRLLIFATLIYILVKLWQGVPSNEILRPFKEYKANTPNGIWKNNLFSIQNSPFSSYEWEDIHIQGLFSDIHIDVTDTVLPKKTSLISVRQGFGKIKIDLPYEIPVRIHYTTLLGDIRLFGNSKTRLVNESLHMKDGYSEASNDSVELIITLSTWIGDIEVTRK
ncbi:cell wall-active antibiotics response protein LiaF [Sporosarcina sp. CAU 1771]